MIITKPKTAFSRSLSLVFSGVTLAAVIVLPVNAVAQTVTDASVPETNLNVPDDLTIFGENDPNVRHATAVVNGQIITGTDIDQRVALLVAANENPVSPEELKRVRLQVLRNLIDETLQIQASVVNEVPVEDAEVDQTYARVAKENFRQDTDAMNKYLASVGSSPASLKQQIRGELSWQRLLRRNITPFVNVADEEVKEVMKRLEESKGVEEYRIGEIYLSATKENSEEVSANGRKIMEQIREGGSFVAYARQFSEASTAPVGGDLGFVRLAQLPDALASAAQQLQVGQLVGPVPVPGGFSILYLIDKRQILTADPRDSTLSLKQLSISFPKGISEKDATDRASAFATEAKKIRGCGDADRVAAGMGASVVDNDGVPVRSLPSQLQDTVLTMSIGESTPPFGSVTEGVRVLILCGRDDPKANSGPTFDQIMANIEDDRVNKRAQTYLRDLRRDAVIDYN